MTCDLGVVGVAFLISSEGGVEDLFLAGVCKDSFLKKE